MKLLVTPARVAETAFRAPEFIAPDAVSEAVILAAQQKFVLPVLGPALCDSMAAGLHPGLLEEYVVPPLVLYVKLLMLPSLAIRAGAAGVTEVGSKNLSRAREEVVRAARYRLSDDAIALMIRAVDHIEEHLDRYPEYDPAANSLNRYSTAGGVVVEKQVEKQIVKRTRAKNGKR